MQLPRSAGMNWPGHGLVLVVHLFKWLPGLCYTMYPVACQLSTAFWI